MGGLGAIRLGLRYPKIFSTVIAIDAALDYWEYWGEGSTLDDLYPTKETCRQDSPVLQLKSDSVPEQLNLLTTNRGPHWYRGNDRFHEKLNALGIPHRWEQANHITSDCDLFPQMFNWIRATLHKPIALL